MIIENTTIYIKKSKNQKFTIDFHKNIIKK